MGFIAIIQFIAGLHPIAHMLPPPPETALEVRADDVWLNCVGGCV